MEWTNEILELIKKAGYKGIPIKDFPEHFLTCEVGEMEDDAETNKELADALLRYDKNLKVYLKGLLLKLAEKYPRIAIELAKAYGILSDVQKIEFEEISTADRLAKFMKDADDEI